MNLTPGETRIVHALVRAALGPVDPPPEATAVAAAVGRMLDDMFPADRRLTRLAFHLLNLSPAVYLRGRNLTGLTNGDAVHHFERLSASRVPPLRRLARIGKTIAAYAYYGLPEAWPKIAYDGPWIGRVVVESLPEPELARREVGE